MDRRKAKGIGSLSNKIISTSLRKVKNVAVSAKVDAGKCFEVILISATKQCHAYESK